ncbi:MAG: hypothetical protein PWP14_562 [Methanolobus sp.]|nr:hypothetical protein [Methanolobus sp.]
MTKKKATPKQLENLAKGRKILALNEFHKLRINPYSHPHIERTVPKPPVTRYITNQTQSNPNISLFDKFMGIKLFSIEINHNKQSLDIRQAITYLLSQVERQKDIITSNRDAIKQLTYHNNYMHNEYEKAIHRLDERISYLEKENSQLKAQIKAADDAGEDAG